MSPTSSSVQPGSEEARAFLASGAPDIESIGPGSPAALASDNVVGEKTPPSMDNRYPPPSSSSASSGVVSFLALKVLVLLAVQNCSKNLLMRYVMKEKPGFLTSAAVIGVETIKLVLSTLYILLVERRPLSSIATFLRDDHRNSMLLAVPAAAYSLQMSLEYVALENIDASIFSVLVQTKLLATAIFAVLILRRRILRVQLISLCLLTVGVMLCNLKDWVQVQGTDQDAVKVDEATMKGIFATLGIALSSGFASVYTEKVIKAQRDKCVARQNYSLAYMQVQLAIVSLIIIGIYAVVMDFQAITQYGLWHNFNVGACFSIFNSAIGGLIVAAVLKFADAVLKGYATAVSVIMTGVLSMVLFGTKLNVIYFLGVINVVCAVVLYNAKDLNKNVC